MGLRVSGGSLRGRALAVPRGQGVRPTAARVREALFSILGQDFTGLRVLDLYAGAGTLGVEAASRGAEAVVFVELDGKHAAILRRNLELLEGRGELLQRDAVRAIDLLAARGEPFDVVFLDPPYRRGQERETLDRIASHGAALLRAGATIVVEAAAGQELPERVGGLTRERSRRYGDTELVFYGGASEA